MCSSNEQLNNVTMKMKEDNVKFVRFEQTDIYGVSRSKIIPVALFEKKATYGHGFTLSMLWWDPKGATAPGFRSEIGFPNGLSFPDLNTYTAIPWCRNTGRILLEPTYKGKPVAAYPRTLARCQLDRLTDMGYSLLSTYEHEFFVVDKDTLEPYTQDNSSKSTLRNYKNPEFTHQLLTDLQEVGINIEAYESEGQPGQVEICVLPSFGIASADSAHTTRTSVKEIALQHGYIASYMTKPWPELAGHNAFHFNHSLWDVKGENSVMTDKNTSNGLSKIAQHWIGGILAHAPAISVLLAPTINCLSVLKKFKVTWGFDNRTTAIRVKEDGERGTYIENRIACGGGNPYIILAATVAAGIDGIQRQMELPPDVKDNARELKNIPENAQGLPTDMKTALQYFNNDNVIREALGEEFCMCFVAHKQHEISMEEEAVTKGDTEWQRKQLFEYL